MNLSLISFIFSSPAQSIEANYPPQRFSSAIQTLKKDFVCILKRLTNSSGLLSLDLTTSFERRLAEFIGQAIRFHLRKLFNPPPLPLTRNSTTESSSTGKRQSNVFELVDLELPECGSRDSAVADGSISSLFSQSLRRIYEYFGVDAFRACLLYTSPSPRDQRGSRMPSSA